MSRNVDLLAQILGEFWGEGTGIYPIAQFMAAKGVLAVDSLTDEQCEAIYWAAENGGFEDIPSALRRCATGEAS